jgi:hypothetical protein
MHSLIIQLSVTLKPLVVSLLIHWVIHSSMAVQPFVGPWSLFHICNPIHILYYSLDGGSARQKASTYTQNNTQASMPRVGLEPTTRAFDWAKTDRGLSSCAVIGLLIDWFIHSTMAVQLFVGPWPLQFRNLFFYTDGRTPWTGDQPVARPLPTRRTTQTQNKRTHKHPCLEWDSNPRSQRWASEDHTLNRATTVIGLLIDCILKILKLYFLLNNCIYFDAEPLRSTRRLIII